MLINRTEPCHHASWMKPVAIHLPLCVAVEIYSPLVALDMLMYRWPEEHGPEYEEARRNCLDAIAGRCDIEKARESFLVASSHAHILVTIGPFSAKGFSLRHARCLSAVSRTT